MPSERELPFKVTANTSGLEAGMKRTRRELRESERVTERSKTAYEKMGDSLARVDELQRKGLLTTQQANRARRQERLGLLGNIGLPGAGAAARFAGAGPLGVAIGALTLGMAGLKAAIERASDVRNITRATGLSTGFVAAVRHTGLVRDVSQQSQQALMQRVAFLRDRMGVTEGQAFQFLQSQLQGRSVRDQRLLLEQMIPGGGDDVRRLLRGLQAAPVRPGDIEATAQGGRIMERIPAGLGEAFTGQIGDLFSGDPLRTFGAIAPTNIFNHVRRFLHGSAVIEGGFERWE